MARRLLFSSRETNGGPPAAEIEFPVRGDPQPTAFIAAGDF